MPFAIMLGGARPLLSDPEYAMASRRIASTCGDIHLAGSRPHASGRVCFGRIPRD
jgi:hypothetical protein